MSAQQDGLDVAYLENLLPFFRRVRDYTRLKVQGIRHVPSEGPGLLVGNHTGWLGLDYVLTALSVYEAHGRVVRGMAHAAWFKNEATATFARKCGIIPITKDAMVERLEAGDLVMMFPEGEKGAFRPGSDYQLEEFARGFVRVAMETQVPVLPVGILGGEEANPVGRRIESYEDLVGMRGGMPIPKNFFPKPVKWRIHIMDPVTYEAYTPEDTGNQALVHGLAEEMRATIQKELRLMKVERGHPYF